MNQLRVTAGDVGTSSIYGGGSMLGMLSSVVVNELKFVTVAV